LAQIGPLDALAVGPALVPDLLSIPVLERTTCPAGEPVAEELMALVPVFRFWVLVTPPLVAVVVTIALRIL
jgi:hypothetical protein